VGIEGILMSLPAQLMSRKMVPFAVGSGCRGVGMGRKVVEFYDSFVRTGGHFVSPACLDVWGELWMIFDGDVDEGEELDRR
jgi:hypothetical protein